MAALSTNRHFDRSGEIFQPIFDEKFKDFSVPLPMKIGTSALQSKERPAWAFG